MSKVMPPTPVSRWRSGTSQIHSLKDLCRGRLVEEVMLRPWLVKVVVHAEVVQMAVEGKDEKPDLQNWIDKIFFPSHVLNSNHVESNIFGVILVHLTTLTRLWETDSRRSTYCPRRQW